MAQNATTLSLSGRRAVVTGGASGIGKACAEAFAAAGHERTPHTAVTRSMLAIQDEQDERMFGHERFSRESSGVLDGKRAVSGPTYAGTPEELAELLAKDEAVQAADLVLVANPSTLGTAYNAKLFAGWMQAWRLLGWAT